MTITTINIPKNLVIKMRLIAKIVFGKSIKMVSMEDVGKEIEGEIRGNKKFLRENRPFFAEIKKE